MQWQELLSGTYGSHPMLDSRFLRPCYEVFGSDGVLSVPVSEATPADSMLVLEPKRFGVYGTFSPSQSQIAPVILGRDAIVDVGSVFRFLPKSVMRVDLFNVDPDYFPRAVLRNSAFEVGVHCVTMSVDCSRSFEEYWSNRPKNLRHNVKRYLKKAREAQHELGFRAHTSREAILEALVRYGELESNGWKGKAGTAIHASNAQGKFYAEVLAAFALAGQAVACELYFGARLASSRLVIMAGPMAVILKTTYDEDLKEFAPGRLGLYFVLEHLFANKMCRTIEFYTNAQRDQIPWADRTREIYNASVYRHGLAKKIVRGLKVARRNSITPLNYGIEAYHSFDNLPKPVRRMWDGVGENDLFSSVEWFRNLYDNVGSDLGELRLIVLYNKAEEPLAIMPAVFLPNQNELRSLANYYSPTYRILVNEEQIGRAEAIGRIFSCLQRSTKVDTVTLFPLADNDDIVAMERAAKKALMLPSKFFETANWTQGISSYADYHSTRSSKLKSTLRRKLGRLQKEGSFEFEIITDSAQADRGLADFNAVYSLSWKPREPYSGFIEGLVKLATTRRSLRLGILRIHGAPVAGQLWLVHGSTAFIYKLAYSEASASYSPGTLLTMRMIEFVVKTDGVTKLDYLTGDDAYKREWMSTRHEMYRIRCSSLTSCRGVYRGACDQLRKIKEVLSAGV